MIPVGSRPGLRAARGSLTLATVAVLCGVAVFASGSAPAAAAAGELYALPASVASTQDGALTTSVVEWELPDGAGPGDTVRLDLPEHVGGAMAGADWVASSGEVIGTVRFDASGALVIDLGDAAADAANRRGSAEVRSTPASGEPIERRHRSDADSTVRPGDRPGGFAGVADRDRGNKFGAWTDDTESTARWTLEAPRGPWDTLEIVDTPASGHRVDCAAGVRVRAARTVDPATGYLLDQVDLAADRFTVSCADDRVVVHVSDVGDEIVEVTLDTIAEVPASVLSNGAAFTASLTTEPEPARAVELRQFTTPDPPTPEPPVEPTPEPTPPPTPEPTPTPTPTGSVPPTLARTGGDAPLTATWVGAGLLLAGAAALTAHGIRRRSSS